MMCARSARRRGRGAAKHEPYGSRGKGEHRALRVGHLVRPEYSKKIVRVITRVFR
jgi:hypothetical protein